MIPFQFAHAFPPGACRSPVVRGVPTQAAVKCRWADGSVKHAIFNVMLNAAPGQKVSLDLEEGSPINFAPFALDAAIEMNGQSVRLADLPAKQWTPNSFIYADHTGAHDLPSPSGTRARPIFHVTYYPGNAFVRFILENSNTQAAGECLAPARFTLNNAEVFSNKALTWQQQMISTGGRLVREAWLNPFPAATPKFNLSYLANCKAVPNFDASIQVAASALSAAYTAWQTSNKDIAQAKTRNWGNFPAAMGTAGARQDWGCYPAWSILSLYTGDARLREVDEGNARLAAMYAMHWREGRVGKPSSGRPIRIWDRPGLQMSLPTNGSDGLIKTADMDAWGLTADPAHHPNPFYLLYLTTGDFFYLEQMWFWAAFNMAYSNPGFRGPTGKEGGIPGADGAIFQTRGQGLILRSLAEAAWITPDDEPEKAYFTQMIDDALTTWEGERNVNPRTDPRWQFGRAKFPQDSPLHVWNQGNDGLTQPPVDFTRASRAAAQWEESVVAYGLNRAGELGFPVQELKDYMAPHWSELAKWLANYRIATKDSAGKYFQTLEDAKAATNIGDDGQPYDVDAWWAANRNLDQGYATIAGEAVKATSDEDLWAWFKAEVYDKQTWSNNPKWAILPRQLNAK